MGNLTNFGEATAHSNKEKDDETESWMCDLHGDILVFIITFVVNKEPSTLTRLKLINKHWNKCLNPNKANINRIWENNICRIMFPFTAKNLKMKRWDRYYQYKYYMIRTKNSIFGDDLLKSKQTEPMYYEYEIIEGCDNDIEAINKYHSSFANNTTDNDTDDNNELFKDDIDPLSGLPVGFKWKLKCPIIGTKLQQRGFDKYYCGVCKKNVFRVTSTAQLTEKVNNGHCVSFIKDYYIGRTMGVVIAPQYDLDPEILRRFAKELAR